jgi:hypothetical protein
VAWSDERLVTCGDLRALLAQLDALTADAERAEAERDEAKKDAAMWKDIADMNYRGFKREKAKVADAKREGARDALAEIADAFRRMCKRETARECELFADKHYARTPVRSVTLGVEQRRTTDGKSEFFAVDWERVIITPEQARAIIALSAGDGGGEP